MSGVAAANVLALLPDGGDQVSLNEIFRYFNWNLRFAVTIAEAKFLSEAPVVGVVICDTRLPDGRWQEMLSHLQHRPVEPPLIVASRLADERLWAEVLQLGGSDVLALPFAPQEVRRSVSIAWRHWCDKLRSARPAAKVMTTDPGSVI